jgi:hypothetical protein
MAEEAQPQPERPSKLLGNLALLLSIGGTSCVFLGPAGALVGIVLGVVAIAAEVRAPQRHAGGGAAMAAILIGACGAYYWYSQGPFVSSLGVLRSRSTLIGANEAGAIGNLRALASAEQGFFGAAGVGYVEPACLIEPRKCAPHLAPDTPRFASEDQVSKTGAYLVTFHAGPKSTETGFQTFAMVSVPRVPGETGRRAFCIDSTDTLFVSNDGSPPPVANGLCATTTPVLR